jgi:hypothetical protein
MVISLSADNVIKYLKDISLTKEDGGFVNSKLLSNSHKNCNLLVTLPGESKLLVKQEHYVENDGTPQEFFNEWLFHQLLQQFPVLGNIVAITPLVVHYDEKNSIIIRNYLTEYVDIASFYHKNLCFPEAIAIAIGQTLGVLHRVTFNRQEYRNFMATAPEGQFRYQVYNPAQGIGSIGPEIFGVVPTDALQFYILYQNCEGLEAAIADLANAWHPCCLTHNDLNLNNILVHSKWDKLDDCIVQLIDWEACAWGDPAFDLGTLIANYLQLWLHSLVVDPTLDFDESLHLAMIPLEVLQPSMLSLIQAYLSAFPMILECHQDFLVRVVQFAGLALIHQVHDMIQYRKYFSHTSLHQFRFGNHLVTKAQDVVLTVFGTSELEILKPFAKVTNQPQQEKKQNLLRLYYDNTRLRKC